MKAGPGTIEAVLFDLHGVLTSSPWAALAAAGTGGGASQEQVLEVMLGDYATDTDHPWHRLERGEISVQEYGMAVTALAEAAGIAIDFAALRGFSRQVKVQEEMVEAVRRLRCEGYRTALVTNNVREMAGGWRTLVAVDELFDAVVDSSSAGVRKPDPRIYLRALEELGGIAPERSVFLDDAEGNVLGARAAGLHAILVTTPAQALAELDALLGRG